MAAAENQATDVAPEKIAFKCCKKKSTTVVICVKCGGAFHNSCATRDWAGKLVFLDKTRVSCCDADAQQFEVRQENSSKNSSSAEAMEYLRRLVDELADKNKILQENANMWKEKYENAIGKTPFSRQKRGKHSSPPPSPRPPPADTDVVGACASSSERAGAELKNGDSNRQLVAVTPPNVNIVTDIDVTPPNVNIVSDIDLTLTKQRKTKTKQVKNAEPEACISVSKTQNSRQTPLQNSQSTDTVSDDKEEWTIVQNRRKSTPRSRRPAPIRGTATSVSGLRVAEVSTPSPKRWFFATGFHPSVDAATIRAHLMENGLKAGIICQKMHTKKDDQRSSFRLGVPTDLASQIVDTSLWPVGILVNHFMNIQSRQREKMEEEKTAAE